MTPSRLRGKLVLERTRWAALAILLAATALRFWNLGAQSLWYDEAYSWWVGTQVSPSASIASSVRELVPPLTYFGWRVWAALTGTGEFALRASSAFAGVLTVAALGAASRRLTRSRVAANASMALAALSPPLVWASREMRMYGPLLAFVALADLALLAVLTGSERHRRRWAWAWGALTLMALYTVVLAGFWLIGQALFALVALALTSDPGKRRSIARALLPPAVAAGLLYLPWLLPALRALGQNQGYWPGTLTIGSFLARTLRGMSVFRTIEPETMALWVAVCIADFALLAPLATTRRARVWLYGPVSTVPAIVLAALVFRTIPKWELQHTVIFAPALILALSAAAGPVPRHRRLHLGVAWIIRIGLAASTAVIALATGRLLLHPDYAHDDWRSLVAYVQARRTEGELVIIETGSVAPTWIYYGGDEGLLPLPDDPLLDVRHVLGYENTAPVLNTALARASGVWVVGWLQNVTDPTDVVGALLDDIGDPTPLPAFHGLELRHFTLTRAPEFPDEPPTTARPETDLLPDLRLWGVALPDIPQPADVAVPVRAWWTITDPERHVGAYYQASVRVYDRRGNLWGQIDAPAGAGDYRCERWPPGTKVLGRYDVPLLPGVPSGTYTATMVLYELAPTGGRSPEIALGAFAVGRPSSPPLMPESITPVTTVDPLSPLNLLGARLHQTAVRPCETLEGWLFWEISAPLVAPFQVRLALGPDEQIVLPTEDVVPVLWETGDRFLTQFKLPIDCHALGAYAPLTVTLLQGEPGKQAEVAAWAGPEAEIAVERAFTPPAGIVPARAQVGEGLAELLGYAIEPAQVSEGTRLRVVLVWQAGTITDVPYTVFVHVVPRGQPSPLVAQDDAWPAEGAKPTYTWVPGEIIADPHPLPGLPAGEYDIRIGIYGPDATRLALVLNGARVLDDVLILAPLTVE